MASPVQPISGEIGVAYPEARITATPGTFWEAMVTMKSGRATPTRAPAENRGVTQIGAARATRASSTRSNPRPAATATPTASAATTA